MINYCDNLKPENVLKNQLAKREEKEVQQLVDLKGTDNKDWEKELKKGAQVIVSKKLKEEEDAPKKVVKEKKKKEKEVEGTTGFAHSVEITKMFD